MSTYQGRMLVLSNHSNLHMLFEVVAQALTKGEGMGGDACEAIMGYLVEKGVAADRLSMVGHGSEKTEDGQAARRVEFNILEKETRSMKPAAEEAPAEEGGGEAPAEEASAE